MTDKHAAPEDLVRFIAALKHPAVLFCAEGRVRAMNPTALNLFGIRQTTAWLDDWFDAYVHCPREYQRAVPRYLAHYLEVHPDHLAQPVMAFKTSGERFAISYTLSDIDAGNGMRFCLCLLTDSEAGWQRQQEFDLRYAELESLSRAKTDFINRASQKLSGPLASLISKSSELSDRPELADYLRQALGNIHLSVRRAQRILQEMRDFTELETGQFGFHVRRFNFRRCLEDAVDSMQQASRRKNLEIATLVSPYVPETVLGDPDRLHQIIENLLQNAITFTAEGGISVKAWCDIETDSNAIIEMEISDTGCGMTNEQVNTLRKAFQVSGGNLAKRVVCLGNGLTISAELVDRMAGKIGVRSTPNVGTTFSLSFNFAKSETDAPVTSSLLNKRALLVNDYTEDRHCLETMCHKWGMQTDYAGHGAQAITKLDSALRAGKPYDCLFIELRRMLYAGVTLARQVRDRQAFATLKIVMLQGADSHVVAQIDRGAIDLLVKKPFSDDCLYRALLDLFSLATVSPVNILLAPGRHQNSDAESRPGAPRRALLVEDSEVNQIIAQSALKKLGIHADVTSNGEEAVAAAQDKHYDLILMDCEMPVLDGFAATRLIRAWEAQTQSHVPIIALSADPTEACRQACLAAGMDDFIAKPFRTDQLHGILQRFANASSPQPE